MKQVLLLLGMSLTHADWFGGDGHDLGDHGETADESVSAEDLLGDVTDGFGCITTAGYTWCETLSKCLQAWEEPCDEEGNTVVIDGTEIDTDLLDDILPTIVSPQDHIPDLADEDNLLGGDEDYMDHGQEGGKMLGGERDENGCLGSAGYTWCAKQATCVRSWELEGDFDVECTEGFPYFSDESSSGDSVSESSSSSSEGSSSEGSSSSSSEGNPQASQTTQNDLEKFFYNEDGTIKPWVFKVFLGLTVTAAILLLCLIRARSMRKRRQRRLRQSAGVQMLASDPDKYSRFNVDEFVFQETVAVKTTEKEDVPNRKEFTNLV